MNTNLGRTECAVLINKSGASKAFGDVVIVDVANAISFTTTTTGGFINGRIGVILEPNGIANNAPGLIAFSGYVPRINLASAAALGDYVKSHTVAGQGTPHAVPPQSGDFAQVLETGANPSAMLFGCQIQLSTGGGAYFAPTGLTGATQASRYVGATASGAPTTGTFLVGDYAIDRSGLMWICTVAGSPGTWVSSGGGGGGRTLISEQTPSGVSSVQWTSIPGTYKKLVLEGVIRSTQAADNVDGRIRFNGDTTDGNYRQEGWRTNQFGTANDTGATARFATQAIPGANATANGFAQVKIEIMQYANTAFTKRALVSIATVDNAFYQQVRGMVHWSNTAAINQIDIVLSAGNFFANSVLRLYGEN